MELNDIGYSFSQRHGIFLKKYKLGYIGKNNDFWMAISNNTKRDRLIITKNFPAINKTLESRVVFEQKGKDLTLNMRILNGCLIDYLEMIDKSDKELNRMIDLTFSYYIGRVKNPVEIISDVFPVDDINEADGLIRNIYPVNN